MPIGRRFFIFTCPASWIYDQLSNKIESFDVAASIIAFKPFKIVLCVFNDCDFIHRQTPPPVRCLPVFGNFSISSGRASSAYCSEVIFIFAGKLKPFVFQIVFR